MTRKLLKKFLKRSQQQRLNIHCLGDAMIDEYYDVKVNRISPEFPMPIMLSSSVDPVKRPGGAANVANQFRHFGVDSTLFCFYDEEAVTVFNEHGIDAKPFWVNGVLTHLPVKRRFLDGNTQIIRHDVEVPLCGYKEDHLDNINEQVKGSVSGTKPDVVVFSDYDKGFFSSKNFCLSDLYPDVVTIVDPKRGPLSKWHGCRIFKPNAKEAMELSGGMTCWREQSRFFQRTLDCESVVITHGGEKVVGVWRDEFFDYRPHRPVHVESVIGAGDCFAAVFAMAIGYGFSVAESSEIAWNAGAVYVQRGMNCPIIPAEISWDGIVEPEHLKNRDIKLVFTNGCFDVLHEGHLQLLRFAKAKGDRLVVAINTDESVRGLKGEGRPIKPLDQRMAVVAALDCVDFVVSFSEPTPLEVIKKIMPDVLVKGADYKPEDIVGADIVPELFRAPILDGLSTSNFLS